METYEPSADSFLLLKAAESWLEEHARPGMKILDMGTGSGFIITNIADFLGEKRTRADLQASDIVRINLPKNIKFMRSDLFDSVEGRFDLVIFNPPYLAESKEDCWLTKQDKKQLIGGRKGNEITLQFLEQLPDHLLCSGVCLLLTSSASRPEEIKNKAIKLGYEVNTIATEKYPFERLSVFLIHYPK